MLNPNDISISKIQIPNPPENEHDRSDSSCTPLHTPPLLRPSSLARSPQHPITHTAQQTRQHQNIIRFAQTTSAPTKHPTQGTLKGKDIGWQNVFREPSGIRKIRAVEGTKKNWKWKSIAECLLEARREKGKVVALMKSKINEIEKMETMCKI